MSGTKLGTLLFDSEIHKSDRAIRKAIREAREATIIPLPILSVFSPAKRWENRNA